MEMERPVWRPVCSSWLLFLGQLPVGQLSAGGLCRRSEVSHQKLLLKTSTDHTAPQHCFSNNLQRSEENISEATEAWRRTSHRVLNAHNKPHLDYATPTHTGLHTEMSIIHSYISNQACVCVYVSGGWWWCGQCVCVWGGCCVVVVGEVYQSSLCTRVWLLKLFVWNETSEHPNKNSNQSKRKTSGIIWSIWC